MNMRGAMFFKKKPKFTMIYDEDKDKIYFKMSGNFTTLMLAIALEELIAENPQVCAILEETFNTEKHTIH